MTIFILWSNEIAEVFKWICIASMSATLSIQDSILYFSLFIVFQMYWKVFSTVLNSVKIIRFFISFSFLSVKTNFTAACSENADKVSVLFAQTYLQNCSIHDDGNRRQIIVRYSVVWLDQLIKGKLTHNHCTSLGYRVEWVEWYWLCWVVCDNGNVDVSNSRHHKQSSISWTSASSVNQDHYSDKSWETMISPALMLTLLILSELFNMEHCHEY